MNKRNSKNRIDSKSQLQSSGTAETRSAHHNSARVMSGANWQSRFRTATTSMIGLLIFTTHIASQNTWADTGGNLQLSVGASAALLDEVFGYGGAVGLKLRASQDFPLYLGVESGIAHWEEGEGLMGNTAKATLNSIPILALVELQLEIPDSSVRPYIGVATGVSMTIHGPVDANDDQAEIRSRTEAQFEMLIKPGIGVGSFFIEPKFGILDGNFIFLPTAGITLNL
jgi:hypothetical protein